MSIFAFFPILSISNNLLVLVELLFICFCIIRAVAILQWNYCPLISTLTIICDMYFQSSLGYNLRASVHWKWQLSKTVLAFLPNLYFEYDLWFSLAAHFLMCVATYVLQCALAHIVIHNNDLFGRQHFIWSDIFILFRYHDALTYLEHELVRPYCGREFCRKDRTV